MIRWFSLLLSLGQFRSVAQKTSLTSIEHLGILWVVTNHLETTGLDWCETSWNKTLSCDKFLVTGSRWRLESEWSMGGEGGKWEVLCASPSEDHKEWRAHLCVCHVHIHLPDSPSQGPFSLQETPKEIIKAADWWRCLCGSPHPRWVDCSELKFPSVLDPSIIEGSWWYPMLN